MFFSFDELKSQKKEDTLPDYVKLLKACNTILSSYDELIIHGKQLTEDNNRLQIYSNIVGTIKENFADWKTSIQEASSNSESTPASTAPIVEEVKHKLIIENQSEENITDQLWTTVVKKNLRSKLKDLPVSNSYLTNKGVAMMTFPSEVARDKAAEELKSDYKITSQSKPQKKLAPKIKIIDVPDNLFEMDEAAIIQEIRAKNKLINEQITDHNAEFTIIYKYRDDRFVVIKTTGVIRGIIRQMNNKIFWDLHILHVRDHVHLVQCYHCQEFGHYSGSDLCKYKTANATCFYCASQDHKSADCSVKKTPAKHRCTNCIHNNRSNTHHKATDAMCPFVIRETLWAYSRTDGLNEESKNGYLRMVERLREKRRIG